MIDHDRLFKELLTTFFVEFVELFLPDVAAYLDPDSLEFLDKEVFTDVTSGEKHEADIVVKAKFRGQPSFFLIHVENQSRTKSEFARRLFRYFARFHEKFGLPVYPVALFSYDAPLRAEPDHYRVEFPGFVVNDFSFRVIQLNRLNWRDFVQQPNPVASALMAKMQIAPEDRPKVKAECLRLLVTLKLNPAKMQLISGFVNTYLRLNTEEMQTFTQEVAAFLPQEKETVVQVMNEWTEMGMEKGSQNEARKFVQRQLTRKFGELESSLQTRLDALTTAQLEDLGEDLLDFTAPDDLTAWLDRLA